MPEFSKLFFHETIPTLFARINLRQPCLGEVASRVRFHHPALKAARLAIEEAKGRQLGAGRLANPKFGYDFQNQSNVSPQTGVFSIDQSFPITGRLSLEKKLTSQLVSAAELQIRDVERKLISDAQQQVACSRE